MFSYSVAYHFITILKIVENIVSNDFCKKKKRFYDIWQKLMMEEEITLPHANNALFAVEDLVKYFISQKINYLIVGASQVTLDNHPKPKSLDVWIRKHEKVIGTKKNTCQAVNSVIERLVEFAQFSIMKRVCPTSNRMCKALVFCDNVNNILTSNH